MNVAPYYKAVTGFVAPGATSLILALQDSSKAGDRIAEAEWWYAGLICVVTAAAVWVVPNKDPQGTHQAESTQPPGV